MIKTIFLAALLAGCVSKHDTRMDYLDRLTEDGQVKNVVVSEDRFSVEMK